MSQLSKQDVQVLETLRQRLAQLVLSLANLRHQISFSEELPPWDSLFAQTNILSTTLQSLAQHVQGNTQLLRNTVVFPLANFPGREHESLLNQLLRKKLQPEIEDWVAHGEETCQDIIGSDQSDQPEQDSLQAWQDLWSRVGFLGNEEARKHNWGEDDDDDDDEDEDEDENVENGKPETENTRMQGIDVTSDAGTDKARNQSQAKSLEMSQILRFMSRGQPP